MANYDAETSTRTERNEAGFQAMCLASGISVLRTNLENRYAEDFEIDGRRISLERMEDNKIQDIQNPRWSNYNLTIYKRRLYEPMANNRDKVIEYGKEKPEVTLVWFDERTNRLVAMHSEDIKPLANQFGWEDNFRERTGYWEKILTLYPSKNRKIIYTDLETALKNIPKGKE